MKKLLSVALLFVAFQLSANKTSSEIYVDVQKLHSLKKVLYVAAHPDDENTRALAYFSLHENAETAYLSLTRGDGGQNLIGKELSEDLGVLRTQELLAARSYDGAKQYFSRAVDFGYSKSAEESLEKWGEDLILADVVLMIRKFKPDVIITRFPPDERGGHGHHTASAMLAIEAFTLAADASYMPEQVAQFGTWQATSIYWNTSTWANPNLEEDAKNNPNYIIKDIGGYKDVLGQSFNEVGTIARSQHKCQGFGAIVERGQRIEYFEYLAGEKLKNDFFEKNTKTWTQLVNEQLEQDFERLLKGFDFVTPENNVQDLLEIRAELEALPNSTFKQDKIALCNRIIVDCLGLYVEMLAGDYAYPLGEEMTVRVEALNRSNWNVQLQAVNGEALDSGALMKNIPFEISIALTNTAKLSTPYWLEKPFDNSYFIEDKANFLQAENKASFNFTLDLLVENEQLQLELPLSYKWRDPAYGQRERAVMSTPDFAVNFSENSVILQEGQEKTIEIEIYSFKDNLEDKLILVAPENWTLSQTEIPIQIANKHQRYYVKVKLSPKATSKRGVLKILDSSGHVTMAYTEIAYDHIATQAIFRPTTLTCVKLDAKIKAGKIAYIVGAGDLVPEAIAQLGFDISVYEVGDLSALDLAQFQSVVLGIRIFNVNKEILNFQDKLFAYVEQGGNLVVQYNTASRNGVNPDIGGPLDFDLSRNRVTEENATVTFLAPKHPIMNTPNKITKADFDFWVQERGLYFADDWDKSFTPLFSWHDKGEEGQEGAIIVANYGKGQFVYTGISFFRQLPRGVEGAYRLFANILSYEPEK